MKKVFALILMLVLVVFAFAACGKSGDGDATTAAPATNPSTTTASASDPAATTANEPAATTADDPAVTTAEDPAATTASEPAHVHVPEAEYWIDQEPTCTTPGQKSLYCEECGEQIPDSIVEIPIDPNAHVVTEWTVTEATNMLHPIGSRVGVCTICNQTVTEELKYEGPIIAECTSSTNRYEMPQVKFDDIRGDRHFYPTAEDPLGNDLYLEFSILWNESILNFDASKDPYMVARFHDGKPLYYFSPVAGCKTSDANFAGAFEWMGNFGTPISDSEVTTPATMCGANPNYADYPNIAGTDEANPEWGWHRVGIRYHLELLDGKSGADLKDYVGIATCFIDGVAVFKLSTGADGMQNWESMLFKAESDGEGGIVYSDAGDYIIPFIMNKSNTRADTTAYLAFSDVYVTCGKDFVMKVEKVASPAAATLEVAEGVEIPAPVYFKLAD